MRGWSINHLGKSLRFCNKQSELLTQARQANAGGCKSTVHGYDLASDVTGIGSAEKQDHVGDLVFSSISVQWNRIMVGGANIGAVNLFGHCSIDGSGGDCVDTNSMFAQLRSLLSSQLCESGLADTVCDPQGAGP